jgi:hypothetical protein
MKNKKYFIAIFLALPLLSCDTEHKGYTISEFTGEYRFYKNIAEFFDCKEGIKYFVERIGAYSELQEAYLGLELTNNDDVYIKVDGYLKKQMLIQDIDSVDVFVATKLHTIDSLRGCQKKRYIGQ